mgnify:CR=1 FL=1
MKINTKLEIIILEKIYQQYEIRRLIMKEIYNVDPPCW